MNTEQIEQLAVQMAEQMPINLEFNLTYILSIVLASAGGYYLHSYLKKRGEKYATKDDFKRLLDQLEKNTTVINKIESQILNKFWTKEENTAIEREKLEELMHATKADLKRLLDESDINTVATKNLESQLSYEFSTKKENIAIRRQKLEELMYAAYQIRDWTSQIESNVIAGNSYDLEGNPALRVKIYGGLYFQHLRSEVNTLYNSVLLLNTILSDVAKELVAYHGSPDPNNYKIINDKYRTKIVVINKIINKKIQALEKKALKLMEVFMPE